MMSFFFCYTRISYFLFPLFGKKRERDRRGEKKIDNFNFLLVGFWASVGKGRMNNHAEPKDKRAFFPLLGSMLAEGEVIFVCLCVYVRYMKRSKKDGGGGFFWKCWERLLHGRRREGDVLSHTHNSRWKILQQQQQLKKERRHGKREKKKEKKKK